MKTMGLIQSQQLLLVWVSTGAFLGSYWMHLYLQSMVTRWSMDAPVSSVPYVLVLKSVLCIHTWKTDRLIFNRQSHRTCI
jgi:hypothetical protein